MHACEHVHEAHAVLMALVYEVADQGKGTESVQRERVTAEQDMTFVSIARSPRLLIWINKRLAFTACRQGQEELPSEKASTAVF